MQSTPYRLLLAAFLAAFATNDGKSSLLPNGSFETPTVSAGTYDTFFAGSGALGGWSILGTNVTVISGSYTESGILFPAAQGDQWLDLTGPGTNLPDNGISQTVATQIGQLYRLSFFVGSATDHTNLFSSTVDLSIDGGTRAPFTNPSASTSTLEWAPFSVDFTASGAQTTLAFFNGSGPGNHLSALDNVSLVAVAIPESASFAALAGLATLALAASRRRRA